MIPRFVIINIDERNEFEKMYQLPYGYGDCPIFDDIDDAIRVLKEIPEIFHGCSVERIDGNGRDVVYRP